MPEQPVPRLVCAATLVQSVGIAFGMISKEGEHD
jgi:hypothetical protein